MKEKILKDADILMKEEMISVKGGACFEINNQYYTSNICHNALFF